jgi:hypothetical protein
MADRLEDEPTLERISPATDLRRPSDPRLESMVLVVARPSFSEARAKLHDAGFRTFGWMLDQPESKAPGGPICPGRGA